MTERVDKEQQIIEEIKKTGYPTEIFSASVLQASGWNVSHNPSFWDKEENQSREFDIKAFKQWSNPSLDTFVNVFLIVECKKSEKPWVFFTTEEKYLKPRLGQLIKWRSLLDPNILTSNQCKESRISDDEIRSFHHYFSHPRQGRTFYEPFKNQEKSTHSQMIHGAVMSAVKATLFQLYSPILKDRITIYYPVIIFNGDLYEAQLNPDNSIKLKSTLFTQLTFNYIHQEPSTNRSINQIQETFTLDIVQENYLDQFLKILDNEHQVIAQRI